MRAGRMKDRITITPPGTLGEWGEEDAGGGTPVTVWADFGPVKTADRVDGNAVLAVSTAKAVIRLRGTSARSTVTFAGVTYAIVAVEPGKRQRQETLYLKTLKGG